VSDFILIKRKGSEVYQVHLKREELSLHIKATLENTDHSVIALIPIRDDGASKAKARLLEVIGDTAEDRTLDEMVEILWSQRENARNELELNSGEWLAMSARLTKTQERRDKLEAVLRVLLSPDTQIEWSPQVSAACDEGERLLKEVK